MDTERASLLLHTLQQQVARIAACIGPKAVIQGGSLPPDKLLMLVADSLGILLAAQHWIITELVASAPQEPDIEGSNERKDN